MVSLKNSLSDVGFKQSRAEEDLIRQMQKISSINETNLKQARNIKDLVGIRIVKLNQEDSAFDLHQDALTYRQ
jgi:uncharacterized protein Smg (DUF494 family)